MVTNPSLTKDANRRRDDPVVTDMVTRARNGDRQAWNALVERYAPLIWSICRRRRLGDADAGCRPERLAEARGPAGHPPRSGRASRLAGLPPPGWNAAVSCAPRGDRTMPDVRQTLRPSWTIKPSRPGRSSRGRAPRGAARGVQSPAPCCQQLIALLIEDPPLACAEISARLGIPAGSIGPNRARCLDKLRRSPAIAALITVDAQTGT
jgi:hypothetical protein